MTGPQNAAGERIEEIRSVVEEHLRKVRTVLPAGVVPAPGSLADRQLHNTETGPGGPWGEEPVRTYLSQTGLVLDVATDHLAGLETLLRPPLLRFAPAAVSRASIECSATVYWLLDPSQTLRNRMTRSLDEQVRSAREMRGTLARFGDEHDITLDQMEQRLFERREELGLPPQSTRPTATDLAGAVLANHSRVEQGGQGFYKYLSALMHGTLYATLQRFRSMEHDAGSGFTALLEPHMSVGAVEQLAFCAVIAHFEAIDRALIYCGADVDTWRAWSRYAGSTLTPRIASEGNQIA